MWGYHKDHTGYQTSIPPFQLQQKIAWCPIIVEWGNCINIHLNQTSIRIWKQLLTSNVNSSRFTRILTGSVMNLFVISSISWGRVAEIKQTYTVKTRLFKDYNILHNINQASKESKQQWSTRMQFEQYDNTSLQ